MKWKVARTTIFGVFILLSVACSNAPKKPNWINNPDRDQAVGQCGPHALGKHKQKECAELRARTELARRHGVTLKNTAVMTESAGTQGNHSQLDQSTYQQVETEIKARVVESYYDLATDQYWVLVEEN